MDTNPSERKGISQWRFYWHEWLDVLHVGSARLIARWWQFLLIIAVGAALFLIDEGRMDTQVLGQVRQPDNKSLTALAKWLSFWGDAMWAVLLAAVLFLVGVKVGSPRWRQAAYACILALLASSILVNVFRCTLGRPRPNVRVADGLYGPHLANAYHSYPSGHASSGFAPAAAVAAASPLVGGPCLIFAGMISWSRLQLNQHHPVDVMAGGAMGTLIGLCFGSAVNGAKFRFRRR